MRSCCAIANITMPESPAMFAWQGPVRGDRGLAMLLVRQFMDELANRQAVNFARNCCCRPWFKLWTQESRVCPPDLIDPFDDEESRRFQRSMRDEAQFLRRVSFQEAMRNDAQFRRFQQIFRLR